MKKSTGRLSTRPTGLAFAGASAPETDGSEMIAEIQKRYDVELDEKALVEENITFKLPSILTS